MSKQYNIRDLAPQIEEGVAAIGCNHEQDEQPWVRLGDGPTEAMDPKVFCKQLTQQIAKSRGNMGPFYEFLLQGKVPLEGVKDWVRQFYFDARDFTCIVAQIIANAEYAFDVRHRMAINLVEELGDGNPALEHPQLIKKIAGALGIDGDELEYVEPIPEVLAHTMLRRSVVKHGNFLEGVAAGALVIEVSVPGRYRKLGKALMEHYNLPKESLDFLWVHCGDPSLENDYGGDAAHIREGMEILEKYATTEGLQRGVRVAVWKILEARKTYQWGLFRHCVLRHDERFREMYPTAL